MTIVPARLVSQLLAVVMAFGVNACVCRAMVDAAPAPTPSTQPAEGHGCCKKTSAAPAATAVPSCHAAPGDGTADGPNADCSHCRAATVAPTAVPDAPLSIASPDLAPLAICFDAAPLPQHGVAVVRHDVADSPPRLTDLVHLACQLTV